MQGRKLILHFHFSCRMSWFIVLVFPALGPGEGGGGLEGGAMGGEGGEAIFFFRVHANDHHNNSQFITYMVQAPISTKKPFSRSTANRAFLRLRSYGCLYLSNTVFDAQWFQYGQYQAMICLNVPYTNLYSEIEVSQWRTTRLRRTKRVQNQWQFTCSQEYTALYSGLWASIPTSFSANPYPYGAISFAYQSVLSALSATGRFLNVGNYSYPQKQQNTTLMYSPQIASLSWSIPILLKYGIFIGCWLPLWAGKASNGFGTIQLLNTNKMRKTRKERREGRRKRRKIKSRKSNTSSDCFSINFLLHNYQANLKRIEPKDRSEIVVRINVKVFGNIQRTKRLINILQYQFMQTEIPIVVTRNKFKEDLIFKNGTPSTFQRFKTKRNPTVMKIKPKEIQPRHQTLDPEERASRTRRISSSAASKRFPKDFFKDEACINPVKSQKPLHKQYEPSMLDTFSHKNFIVAQGEYLMPEKQQNIEDTPKFTQKKLPNNHETIQKDLLQRLVAMKMQDSYIPQKSKYNTCPEGEQKTPLGIMNHLHQNQRNVQGEGLPMVSNFNLTLGFKDTLTGLMEKGTKFKRRREAQEKQNATMKRKPAQNTKRQSLQKVEGFRIRRKVLA